MIAAFPNRWQVRFLTLATGPPERASNTVSRTDQPRYPGRPTARHHTRPDRDRTALHLDKDHLHFCLAPMTSTPRPCPARSPGVLRIAREITRAFGRTPVG